MRDHDSEIFKELYNELMPNEFDSGENIKTQKTEILLIILRKTVILNNVECFRKFFDAVNLRKSVAAFTKNFNLITQAFTSEFLSEFLEVFKEKYTQYVKNSTKSGCANLKKEVMRSYNMIINVNSKVEEWKTFVTKVHLENGYKDDIYKYFMGGKRRNLQNVILNSEVNLLKMLTDFYGADKILKESADNRCFWYNFIAFNHIANDASPHVQFNSIAMLDLLYSNLSEEISYYFNEAEFKENFIKFIELGNWIMIERLLYLYETKNNLDNDQHHKFYYSLLDILQCEYNNCAPRLSFRNFINEDLNLRNKIAFDNIIDKVYFRNPYTWRVSNYRRNAHLEFFLKNVAPSNFLNPSQVKDFIRSNSKQFMHECSLQNDLDISIILLKDLNVLKYVISLFDTDQKITFLKKFCAIIESKFQSIYKVGFIHNLKISVLENRQIFDYLDSLAPDLDIKSIVNDSVSFDDLNLLTKQQIVFIFKHLADYKIREIVYNNQCTQFFTTIFIKHNLEYRDFYSCLLSRLDGEDKQQALKVLLKSIMLYFPTSGGIDCFSIIITQIQDKDFILDLYTEKPLINNASEGIYRLQSFVDYLQKFGFGYYIITIIKDEILKLQTTGHYETTKIDKVLSIIAGSKVLSKAELIYSGINHDMRLMLSKVFLYEKSFSFDIEGIASLAVNKYINVNGLYVKEDIIKFASQFPKSLQILYDNYECLLHNNLPALVSKINDLTLALATRQSAVLTSNWESIPKDIRGKITEYLGVNYDDMLALKERAKAKVISYRAAIEKENPPAQGTKRKAEVLENSDEGSDKKTKKSRHQ
ncbi:MAG: hypothetical protein BGO27_06020 [Alphaproteobacteria bacterium 33-17]|nr:MAG: hypothetical protein BGO27_06020 [Alphaproteobacteria bacterium 33-17]